MNEKNKPRLADVAKKNTTDRASKLASAFLPKAPAPVETPPVAQPAPEAKAPVTPSESLAEVVQKAETDFAEGRGTTLTVDEINEAIASTEAEPTAQGGAPKRERKHKSTSSINIQDLVGQAAPDNLRCVKPIMLSEEHHQLLRDLNYRYKKPMTTILYNLLEVVNQAYQREQKGDANA